MLAMTSSLIIIGKLRTNAFAQLAFIISLSLANYCLHVSLIDVTLQVMIFLHSNIQQQQSHSTNKAFHQMILSLKEEILNNNNYVAGVVHDLRNPLTEIYSCAELLGQNIPQNQQTPDIFQIIVAFKRNSENLISMVNNILDYAKIKAKKLELDLQPTNIREFLSKIVDMHQVRAQQKGIKLSLIFEDDSLPEKLYIDQSRLTNILVNLASNAIKFTQQGGVSIFAHWFPDRIQVDPLVTTDKSTQQKTSNHFGKINQASQEYSGSQPYEPIKNQQLENRLNKEPQLTSQIKPQEEQIQQSKAKPKDSSQAISEFQQVKRPNLLQLKKQPCEASFGRDMIDAVNNQRENKLKQPSQFHNNNKGGGTPRKVAEDNSNIEEFGTPVLAKQPEDNDSLYSSVPRLKLQDIKDSISDNNNNNISGSPSPVKNDKDLFQFEERKSVKNTGLKASNQNRLLNSSNDESPSLIEPGGGIIGQTNNTSLMLETNLQIGEEGDYIETVKEFLPLTNVLENGSFDINKSGAIQSQLYQGHKLQSTQFRTNRILPPHSFEQSNEIKIKICSLEEEEQEKVSSSSSAAMIRVGSKGQQQKDPSPFQRNSPDLTVSMLGSQFSGVFGLNRHASNINTRTFGSTNQQFATTFSKEVAIEKTLCNMQHSHFQRNNGLSVLSQNVAHASTFTLNNMHTSPERTTIKGQTITNCNLLTIQGVQESCEVESYHKKEIVFTLAPEEHSHDGLTSSNFGLAPGQRLSQNAVRPIFRMIYGSDYTQETPKLEPEYEDDDEEKEQEVIVEEEESKVTEDANKLQSLGLFTPLGAAILAQNSGLSGFPLSSNIEKKLIKGQTISCSKNESIQQFSKISDQNPSTSKIESQNAFSNLTSVELKKNWLRNSNHSKTRPIIADTQAKQALGLQQQASSGTLILQVADTGIGIPSEFKKKLFQPFGQAHKGIQKSFGGTGLGLWISKMIVELMGGQISLESQENLGSRFTIQLQMKVAKPEPTISSSQGQIMNTLTFLSQTNNSHYSNTLQSRNLLVLSDSFSIKLLQGYAEPLKFSIKQITQTSSLIQLILEQGKKCIFFDEEYSHQIIKYVKKFKKQNQIILVALKQQINQVIKPTSNQQRSGIRQILKEAEIDYVMRKPLLKSEFNQILSKVLLRMQLSQEYVSHSMNEIPRLTHHDSTSFAIDNQGPRSAYGIIDDNLCDTNQMRFINPNSLRNKQDESGQILAMPSPANRLQNLQALQTKQSQGGNPINNTQPVSSYNNTRMTPQSRAGFASPFRGGFQNEIMGQFSNSIRQSQLQLQQQHTSKLPKLLLVDDSDFLLKIMAQLVDRIKLSAMLNFEVILATNGEEAFNSYNQYQKEIKLILMDIQMPVMDGYQSAQKIREFEEYNVIQPQVNIVALSGDSTTEHMKKCRQVQINETFQKPISRDQLEQLLKNSFACVI